MSDAHKYRLEIEDGRVFVAVTCPYDPLDVARPCWPYEFGGETPLPGPQENCNYQDWIENTTSEETLLGFLSVPVDCDATWDNDSFVLRVLGIREVEVERA